MALATDYDGTLAAQGKVAPRVVKALEALQRSGRKLVMVTGREMLHLRSRQLIRQAIEERYTSAAYSFFRLSFIYLSVRRSERQHQGHGMVYAIAGYFTLRVELINRRKRSALAILESECMLTSEFC